MGGSLLHYLSRTGVKTGGSLLHPVGCRTVLMGGSIRQNRRGIISPVGVIVGRKWANVGVGGYCLNGVLYKTTAAVLRGWGVPQPQEPEPRTVYPDIFLFFFVGWCWCWCLFLRRRRWVPHRGV